ncbi:MAG: DUF2723 domain-containing protein [candidate division Zixibacteria bacterium]|nr:DUF2723 domain-containing protein [candidate division Zixibacteria bacterium]
MKFLPEDISQQIDRTNAIMAFGVWLVAIVVYSLTKAPTLSFWDCGEFIATGYILGIPHPPGTPLYVMVARIFSIIPFVGDIAARINFLSAVCSSMSALFAYLAAVRILRHVFPIDGTRYRSILIYAGGASGALIMALSRTNWNNSVEAEVYGMAMMLTMGILWLTMIYFDNRGKALADRVLLLAVYLAFLGIGVHMTVFMILPVAMIVFILKKDTPASYWFLLGVFFLFELYLIFALSSRPDEIPFYVPLVIVTIMYAFYVLSQEKVRPISLLIGGGFLVSSAAALGPWLEAAGTILHYVGMAAFAGLVLIAIWIVLAGRFAFELKPWMDAQARTAAYFVLTALVMVILLVGNVRGYAAFLGISALVFVAVAALVWRQVRLPVLLPLAAISVIVLGVREYAYGTLAAVIVGVLGYTITRRKEWLMAVMIAVVAALGFSVHTFVPIRSAQQPYINENNPSQSLDATINFLERKQYGSMGMVERMFTRRAEWVNQFGTHSRMGFWGFFQEQYGVSGPAFLLVFILGVFGLWEICRRRPEVGLPLVILLLLCSVGLILYMNFADGTRRLASGGDYLEVRDRDYFFTPAYMIFGLAIGFGVAGFIQYVRESIANFSAGPRRIVLGGLLVLFLLPVYSLANNYYYCDRSRNYMPYDYAWNLLISADENAVLFTNGDNDTFPLWCLQEVYGVRKDVRVVNLSLANTDWYIKQIRDNMGLHLPLNDSQIDEMRPYRVPDGRRFRVQDQVVDAVVKFNFGRVPINFALTCSGSVRQIAGHNIDSLLEMSAMMFRLTTKASPGMRIDVDRTLEYFTSPEYFKFRGLDDASIYKSETATRLSANVANSFLVLADALQREGKVEQATGLLRHVASKVPFATSPVQTVLQLLADQGRPEEVQTILESNQFVDRRFMRVMLARAYRARGDRDTARSLLTQLLDDEPDYRAALDELMTLNVQARDVNGMLDALNSWLADNPYDREIRKVLDDLQAQIDKLGDSADQSGDTP